ncbi:CoA-binding protein [Leptospira sp. GIMC2001]|uniref:CoA-binding protein n=1 Tax=Leptospira sp. GIMC2001 TaxID=1513297 RepID=UPI00234975D4|nr:CoA-binding protein [Leptospira sp. GIMC2001]WCL50458.1 CoA-binding protein [Leptospira sp. GIMC2001]
MRNRENLEVVKRNLMDSNVVIGLVGASSNPNKFGNIILHHMRNKGYDMRPINPRADSIDGIKSYATIQELSDAATQSGKKLQALNFVLPSKLGANLIAEGIAAGVKDFWFQPGAEGEEVYQKAKESGITPVYIDCIMVEMPTKI